MRRPVLFRDWFSGQILFNMPDTFFICHGEPTQKPHHTTLQSFELAKIQTCYLYFAMLVGCWWGKAKFLGPGRVWAVNEFGVIVIISTRFSDPHRQLFRLFFPQRLAIFAAKRRSTKKKNWLAYQRYRYQSTLFSRKLSRTFPWLFHLPAIPRLLNQLAAFSLALFAGTKSNFISTRVSFERAFSFTLFVTHSIDSLRCKDENSDNAERSLIIRLRFGPTENGKSGKTRSLGEGGRWV